MATITSAQSGLRADTSTWAGGAVPGIGDNAIVANGHTVTNEGEWSIGASPTPASDAITLQGTGNIINNGSMVVSGNITAATGGIVNNEGSSFTWNVGEGLNYGYISETYGAEGAGISFNGTSESRCTVTKTGDGAGYFRLHMSGTDGNDVAAFIATYTDFSGLGSSTNRAIYNRRGTLNVSHCTFDGCRGIGNITSEGAGSYLYPECDFIVSHCNFANSADTYDVYLQNQSVSEITGTRAIEHTAFDGGLQIQYRAGMSITDSYIETYSHSSQASAADYIISWERNFIGLDDQEFNCKTTLIKDNYRYIPTYDNAHPFVFTDLPGDTTFQGNIIEHGSDWVTNEPDGILNTLGQTSARVVTVIYNIVLPNAAGRASSTLFTDNCSYGNLKWIVENNTCYSDAVGGALVAAHEEGEEDRIQSFRNNICWANDPVVDACLMREVGDYVPIANYITVADYNAYNLITTAYDVTAQAFASTPGTHDLVGSNPQFVDSTRDLAKWSQVILGNTGTESELRTSAINSLKAMNKPDSPNYNPLATVANLTAYVKAGFAPQNATYTTAGYDGGYIGAVEPVSGGSYTYTPQSLLWFV
jgi:hypothetical protein